jgi:phosphonatase-like hydrolase
MSEAIERPLENLELFLFDIGGTVLEEDGLVLRAFLTVAEHEGLTTDPEWYRTRMGLNKRAVLEEALAVAGGDTGRAGELADAFAAQIDLDLTANPPRPYDGLMVLIELLEDNDVKVGFVTGFAGKTARAVVDHMGWPADVIVGSDEVGEGRPAPDLVFEAMKRTGVADAANVAVCGDTPYDVQSGKAAGAGLVVAIGHGSHTLEELAGTGADLLVQDLFDLAARVQQMSGADGEDG